MRCTPTHLVSCLLFALPFAAGCPPVSVNPDASMDPDSGPVPPDAGPTEKTVAELPLGGQRALDLLFVIDSSGSMQEEQASLATNFDRFTTALEDATGALPDLHVGVISTDLGAGPYENIDTCSEGGDQGILQSVARGTCAPPQGAFIRDVSDGQGGRQKNYSGTLSETFSCIAQLGIGGCGFEQPLEAMRRALDGSNPENEGFLREDAYLAVVFISDEDDCSVQDPAMFDPQQSGINSELGPFTSFRCFEFGVECDEEEPRAPGSRSSCRPRSSSPFMYGVEEYADFLRALKPAGHVIVAGIIGDPSPVAVGTNDIGNPTLEPSCDSAAGEAAPGVRFQALLDAFPGRSAMQTICNEDLSGAVTEVAGLVERSVGSRCLVGSISDTDPASAGVQPSCEAIEIAPGGEETSIPVCDNPASPEESGNLPCHLISKDPVCEAESGLSVRRYPSEPVSPEHRLEVRCLVD